MCTDSNEFLEHQARQIAQAHCEYFRGLGGSPEDALRRYGLTGNGTARKSWEFAVEQIARAIASPSHMRGLYGSRDRLP